MAIRTTYATDFGRLTIEDVASHRNGIAGAPFCVVTFTEHDGVRQRQMVGILFEHDEPNPVADASQPTFVQTQQKIAGASALRRNPL